MKNIFTQKNAIITDTPFLFNRLSPDASYEQRFRMKTVEDIQYLEDAGKKDLACLEAQKLIIHLKTEFGLEG